MKAKSSLIVLLIVTALLFAACDIASTGDKSTDAAAAQQFIPHPANYSEIGTEGIQDTLATTLAGAGLATGNVAQTAIITQIDSFISCYRDVGAFEAKIHVKSSNLSTSVPPTGVVGVLNQNRAISNFLSCASPLRGQSDTLLQPCSGGGTFQAEGDTFSYIYAATSPELCSIYDAHFAQWNPTRG